MSPPSWQYWPASSSLADYSIQIQYNLAGFQTANLIDSGGITGLVSARLDSDQYRIRFDTTVNRDAFLANFSSASGSEVVIDNPSNQTLVYVDPGGAGYNPADGEWSRNTSGDTEFEITGTYVSGIVTIDFYINGAP